MPTLDNRWGDFRLPATERLIGPEARRFRYREEQGTAGTDLGWHTAGLDDSHWQDYLYSEGPFAYSLGPFRPGTEPVELDNGAVRLDAEHVVDGRTHRWQPFAFSPRYGHRHSTPGDPDRSSFEGVPEEYIVFPPSVEDGDAAGGHVRYLLARVVAPAAGEWDLLIGGVDGAAVAVRLNGAALALSAGPGERRRATVKLAAGTNELLLKLAHVGERPIRMYAALLAPGEAWQPPGAILCRRCPGSSRAASWCGTCTRPIIRAWAGSGSRRLPAPGRCSSPCKPRVRGYGSTARKSPSTPGQ